MSQESNGAWLSAHIHVGCPWPSAQFDQVLVGLVSPLVERALADGAINQFFWVRYSEGGPHVRLRLRVRRNTDVARLTAEVSGEIERWRRIGIAPEPVGLKWVEYEPETNRYGGHAALSVCERFFHCSSQFALDLLAGSDLEERRSRLGQALLAIVVLAHSAFGAKDDARALAKAYMRGNVHTAFAAAPERVPSAQWLAELDRGSAAQAGQLAIFVSDAWERLIIGESLTGPLDAYAAGARHAMSELMQLQASGQIEFYGLAPVGWNHCAMRICGSLMHMTNNRLGLSRREEAYVAALAAASLADVQQNETVRESGRS